MSPSNSHPNQNRIAMVDKLLAMPTDFVILSWLMVFAVLGAGTFTGWMIHFVFLGRDYISIVAECLPQLEGVEGLQAGVTSSFDTCVRSGIPYERMFMIGASVFVLLTAVWLYWRAPYVRLRREKLEPMMPEDAEDVLVELKRLSQTVGLKTEPKFVWAPLNFQIDGLAFGRLNQPYIGLSGGLVTLYYDDLPRFQALVLHELSHIRNRDLNLTFAMEAIFQAYIWAAFLPLIMATAAGMLLGVSSVASLLGYIFRGVLLFLIILILHRSILRAREKLADVRAVSYHLQVATFLRAFSTSSPHVPKLLERSIARIVPVRWRSVFLTHPPNDARVDIIKNPVRLLTASPMLLFLVAMTSGLADSNWSVLFTGRSVFASSLLLVGSLFILLWRIQYAGSLKREAIKPWQMVLVSAAGFYIGQVYSVTNLYATATRGDVTGLLELLNPAGLIALMFWSAVMFLIVLWLKQTVTAWRINLSNEISVPNGVVLVVAAVCATFSGFWLFRTTFVFFMSSGPESLLFTGSAIALVIGDTLLSFVPLFIVLVGTWILPTVGYWFVSDHKNGVAEMVKRLLWPTVIAVGCGSLLIVAVLVARSFLIPIENDNDTYALIFAYIIFALGGLSQIAASFYLVYRWPPLRRYGIGVWSSLLTGVSLAFVFELITFVLYGSAPEITTLGFMINPALIIVSIAQLFLPTAGRSFVPSARR